MQIGPRQKAEAGLAAVAVLVLACALLIGGVGQGPRPALVAVAHKVPTRVAKTHRHSHHARRIARRNHRHNKTPVRAADAIEPGTIPVQFPKPTPITIAVAAAPQFVKLDGHDQPLKASAKKWQCVRDRSTGLVWETKTHDRGLRDAQNFYSWFDPAKTGNGGYPGVPNHGKCRGGIACDTHAYIQAVNRMKLCGYSDWRLPTRAELSTLIEYHTSETGQGLVDTRYFPSGNSDWYWSADSDRENPRDAWYVLYYNGRMLKAPKSQAKRIRLVRGAVWIPAPMMAKGPLSDASLHDSTADKKNESPLLAKSLSPRAVD
jgi:hypothetical protein